MFGPVRLWFALRSHPSAGLLAAAIAVAVLFAATPFILQPIADEYGVALGTAGLLSAAQVGGFALTAFVAGRTLHTHRRYLVAGSLVATVVNVASVFITGFEVLLVVRVVAGSAAGLLVWLAWANAMRTSGALRNVASAGPLSVLLAVPVLAALADAYGSDAVFLTIAAVSLPPAFLKAEFAGFRPERRRMSPSRTNVVLVVALGLFTMAGSALFVFGASIGRTDLGMHGAVVSGAYSLNAFTGLIAARRHATDRLTTVWVFGVAASAALVAFGSHPVLFVIGLGGWGFCFWTATPNILRAVAAWSLVPDERVGDAQSAMATGRAVGPAVAAALVADRGFAAVGIFAVAGLIVVGAIVEIVRRYRRDASPPAGSSAATT